MAHRYPIPANTVRTEITIKRSRFIATIGTADTVAAAKEFIQNIRDEMPDATHHVYAFRIGYGSSVIEGLSDDREPAGTAGKPVMAVLRGSDLGDVVVVVTRYFGGTKLGTGGLVRAYSRAVQDALEQLPVIEKVSMLTVEAVVPYHAYDQLKRILAAYEAQIIKEDFARHITVHIAVPEDQLEVVAQRVCEVTVDTRELNIVG